MTFADLSDLFLSTERNRRKNIHYWIATALLTVLCLAVLWFEAHIGVVDSLAATAMSVYMGTGLLAFYLLTRLGRSHALRAEVMGMWQGYHAVFAIVVAYALVPPIRGALFAVLLLIVTFCSSCMPRRQTAYLAWVAAALFTLVAVTMSQVSPLVYPLEQELVRLVLAIVSLFGVVVLTGELSRLRLRLKRQKHELARLLHETTLLAARDELTRLPNRRRMTEIFRAEMERHEATRPLCVAMLDIDFFKSINDLHGHAVGDMALHSFALQLQGQLRSGDAVGRWGGEEFLLILPDTWLDEAEAVINRLRAHVGTLPVAGLAAPLRFTFSAGVSQLAVGKTMDEVIDEADRAMFQAKINGRNMTFRYRKGTTAASRPGRISRHSQAANLGGRQSPAVSLDGRRSGNVGAHSYVFQVPPPSMDQPGRRRRDGVNSRPTELVPS